MSFFDNIRSAFGTTEKDVVAFMMKVWNEEKIVAKEIGVAAEWIVKSGLPALTNDVAAITPFVSVIGTAAGHPELAANMAALNVAMAGVQAFSTAVSGGSLTADQVVQGYGSLKAASAAAQKVVSTAATIVAVTPPSTAKSL